MGKGSGCCTERPVMELSQEEITVIEKRRKQEAIEAYFNQEEQEYMPRNGWNVLVPLYSPNEPVDPSEIYGDAIRIPWYGTLVMDNTRGNWVRVSLGNDKQDDPLTLGEVATIVRKLGGWGTVGRVTIEAIDRFYGNARRARLAGNQADADHYKQAAQKLENDATRWNLGEQS